MTVARAESWQPLAADASTSLVLRLRRKQTAEGRAGAASTAGEVELDNQSTATVEIEVRMSPWQYLDLLVTDAQGEVVSAWHYGDCFSPLEASYVLRLSPGEKYTGNVSLLGNVPPEKRRPGTYQVQAIFACKSLRVVSEPLLVPSGGL